jgi:tetratricopeptide (TPR) repeat protein
MTFRLGALFSLSFTIASGAVAPWSVARSEHFEIYSHRGAAEARAALLWFEQLRQIVRGHFGSALPENGPVAVFGFSSIAEYDPYRLGATADAYYIGAGGRDYIVMPTLGPENFATAAHEYAHLAMHAAGGRLPPWLSEGLADVFSTIRITPHGAQLAGEPAGRLRGLRAHPWLPLATLLTLPQDAPMRNTREGADIFYAQSWALVEMLLASPQYAPRFTQLLTALAKPGANSPETVVASCGRPLTSLRGDLENWIRRRKPEPIVLGGTAFAGPPQIEVSEIAHLKVQLTLAGVLLAAEDLIAAEGLYREAALEAPRDPSVLAGLASVMWARGKTGESLRLFEDALSKGLADADLCYRYAVLLDGAGGPVETQRAALSRAIALRPRFDDARYALALLEKNSGNNQAALDQLRAMHSVSPTRAYHYWSAVADALIGIGQNDEAAAAARTAAEFASDQVERFQAAQLEHTARTHLAVRFAVDESGHRQLVTTRVPNDVADWNPFIEPSDHIRRVEGALREIDCSGPVTRLIVESGSRRVAIAIPDPTRVQMRHAPTEFVCGEQSPADVVVEYAVRAGDASAEGIARGIEFRTKAAADGR